MGLSNLLIPAVMFFALGVLARLVRSDLRFPPDLAKALSIYLLMSIGLHGGYELARADLLVSLNSVLWAVLLGFGLPVIGYLMLIATRRVDPMNAAAISAHYGSVSAGTFLTAIAFLDASRVSYESYPVIMLAVMESPAIIVGLLLASWARRRLVPAQAELHGRVQTSPVTAPADPGAIAAGDAGAPGVADPPPTPAYAGDGHGEGNHSGGLKSLLHEAFTNGSVLILVGSMVIGATAQKESVEALKPFIDEIFMGVLALFLFEMGMVAGQRLGEFRSIGWVLGLFGIVMPLVGGAIGIAVGTWILDFSAGGTTLVAVLGASASYIAVPPAMRLAVPEANPSFYLTLSLGITFPFNVVIGIPVYFQIAQWLNP